MAIRMNGTVTLLHVMDKVVKPTRASLQEEAKPLAARRLYWSGKDFIPVVKETGRLK
jgi:hypothetical protein